ncbi:WD40 repeat-like protein [Choiromyces venosus 120613-1]|uniref:methylated diphthine methylhydrolase n=1 Tax=Choiromyces venosus 120613-1 TaxID=1336337 RepID=A0A3N4JRQ1_9PEZI|nr:WD40 repeat-like protein [Choiromyces venosus 120613-1]
MSSIESSFTTFTSLPPSCILFVPKDERCVVVGTYLLNEDAESIEEKKTGSLLLYRIDDGKLNLVASQQTHAILDIKFSPHSPGVLAVAQSNGTLSFYNISNDTITLSAHHVLFDASILLLSVNFSPTAQYLAFTLSNGEVGILSLESKEITYQYSPHELEAWTCEFTTDGKGLYSGGDDSVICLYDLEAEAQLWRDRKAHQAGVTAILDRGDGTLLTGSYDEWLRIFDGRTRMIKSDIKLGGGVWRLQMRSEDSVLASCMHAGARVVSVQDENKPSVVAKFEEHESMNYGSHVHGTRLDTIVSCSFYDKRLCIWSL